MKNNLRSVTENQKKELLVEMLSKLNELFKENNITYFLAYGTLIGAIRHNGFIPWDDDIDLLLPREDFIKLIRLLEKNSDKYKELNIEILEYGANKKDYYKRFKIADTRTCMVEFGSERSGVFIDIFPLDCFNNMPMSKLFKTQKKILWLDNLASLCHAGVAQGRGLKKHIYRLFLCAYKLIGLKRMENYLVNKILKIASFKEDGKICASEAGVGYVKFFDTKAWSNSIMVEFEGLKCPVPVGYHEVLTAQYGDYMKLPPESERHSHEYYEMFWRE